MFIYFLVSKRFFSDEEKSKNTTELIRLTPNIAKIVAQADQLKQGGER